MPLQLDNLQLFIDSEIAKKEEKDRIIHDRQATSVAGATKKAKGWEEELRDDTRITESADEFLSLYFLREKVVMEKIFGGEWKKHLRHPHLNRDHYQVVSVDHKDGSESSETETTTRQSEATTAPSSSVTKTSSMAKEARAMFALPNAQK